MALLPRNSIMANLRRRPGYQQAQQDALNTPQYRRAIPMSKDVTGAFVADETKKALAAKESGILIYSSHIMGFPNQTLKRMENQVRFGRYLVDVGLSNYHIVYTFSVLPGTGYWNRIMEPTTKGEFKVKKKTAVVLIGRPRKNQIFICN